MKTVTVNTWPAWFSAGGRESAVVEWRSGMVVEELVPSSMRGQRGLVAHLNGAPQEDFTAALWPGDYVDFAIRPGGPGFAALPLAIQLLLGVAASWAINITLKHILGTPQGPKRRGDEDSPHAAWGGPSNVRVEGQPRMVVYGEFRVAGTVIDEFVVTQTAPPKSTLYSLLTFGEGPIQSIGGRTSDNPSDTPLSSEDPANPLPTGIQLEGNALENFRNVEAHVRMGTSQQEAIPGFELVATDYEVGATLSQAQTTGSQQVLNSALDLITIPYNSNAAGAQALWDTYGFAYDMTSEADQFTALVNFTGGLYGVNGSGSIVDAGFQVLMRYKELDSLGAPINTGGDNGDGFVYVPPEPMMLSREQSAFGREYSGIFHDPQVYVAGSLGRACFFDGVDDYATTNPSATDTIPNAPSSWVAGQDMAAITIEGWIQFDGLPAAGGSDYRPLIEIGDGSNARGIALFVQRFLIDQGGGGPQPFWVPTVYTGNGATRNAHGANVPNFIPSATGLTSYHHVACSYRRIDSVSSQIRIYLDGVMAYGASSTHVDFRVVSSGKALEMGRSRPGSFAGSSYTKGRFDEWRVYQRELTPSEIATAYGAGIGTYGAASTDLVAGWHLDEGLGVTTGQDFGNFQSISSANDLYFKNGAGTGATGTGRVNSPGSGALRRAKYRVNLLRLNLKSSSAFVIDESVWSILYGKIDEQLAYPNKPLLALKVQATDQLNGTRPLITELVRGRQCPIWDGLSTVAPTITNTWTKNPAWICLDIATNKRYGRGQDFDFTSCDLNSFKEWADYCDELIYDNRGQRQNIHESDTAQPIGDLRYDSTLFGGFGGIEIHFRSVPAVVQPPGRWAVGRFLGFTGIPFPTAGLNVDINTTNIKGMEIGSLAFVGGANWQVGLKYDKATYGAPWADGGFLSVSMTAATLVGVVEGREKRFEYSWPHDTFRNTWDTLIDIGMTARAMPMREGRKLRFRVEKPRTPVGIVTMASIKPGTWEIDYGGSTDRTNSVQADYWDEDQNYERKNASFDDPSLSTTALEEEIHREGITLEGVTRRSQVLRDCFFRVKVNRLVNKAGRYRTGLEALAYEVGDVVQISHDIVPWGKGGRIGTGSTVTSIVLDRTIVLAAATTYYLKVSTKDQAAVGAEVIDKYETAQVTQAAGTYAAGTPISVAGPGYTFTPAKDDTYLLYKLSEVLLAEIVEISLTEDFERAIEWVKYDVGIFDVDVLPSDISASIPLTIGPPVNGRTIPLHPRTASAVENVEVDTDGGWSSRVGVTWQHDPDTLEAVGSTAIFLKTGSGWTLVSEVRGVGTRTSFVPPAGAVGSHLELAVQPRSFLGLGADPDSCVRVQLDLTGMYVGPPAPTGFTAAMFGDKAQHAWMPPAGNRSLCYEARRGGWILGQPVFTTPFGMSEAPPVRNWAGTSANIFCESAPNLYLRARDPRGQESAYALVSTFNPAVDGAVLLSNVLAEDTAFASLTITGGATAVYGGRTCIEFTGSGSTLVIQGPIITRSVGVGERQYVEFVCAVDQVPPLLVSDWQLQVDHPLASRRTVEGPTSLLTSELANCTIVVEMRSIPTLGLSVSLPPWVPYKPCVLFAVAEAVQFRVTITRPDATYNARVYRFGQRHTRVPKQRHERNPQRWTSISRVVNHG